MPDIVLHKMPTPYVLVVTEDQELFQKRLDMAWLELKKKTPSVLKIKGFREQAVTRQVAEKYWGGRGKLFQNVYNELAQEGIDNCTEVEVSGVVRVDCVADDSSPKVTLEVTLDVYPGAKAPLLEELQINPKWGEMVPISDDEVNRELQAVRERHVVFAPLTRPAQKGDVVTIDLYAYSKEKPVKELELVNFGLTLGANAQGTLMQPAFEEALIGKEVGALVTLEADVPAYGPPKWKGKKLEWRLKLMQVYEKQLPTDEDLAATENADSPEHHRQQIRSVIEQSRSALYEENKLRYILSELAQKTQVDPIPDSLVKRELDSVVKSIAKERQLSEKENQQLRQFEAPRAYSRVVERVAARHFADKYGLRITTMEDMKHWLEELEKKGAMDKFHMQKALEDAGLDKKIFKGVADTMLPRKVAVFIWRRFEEMWSKDGSREGQATATGSVHPV